MDVSAAKPLKQVPASTTSLYLPKKATILYQKAYENIEQWHCRPLTGEYAYVYMDGV